MFFFFMIMLMNWDYNQNQIPPNVTGAIIKSWFFSGLKTIPHLFPKQQQIGSKVSKWGENSSTVVYGSVLIVQSHWYEETRDDICLWSRCLLVTSPSQETVMTQMYSSKLVISHINRINISHCYQIYDTDKTLTNTAEFIKNIW